MNSETSLDKRCWSCGCIRIVADRGELRLSGSW
jgi:hypothetical protein